MSKNVEQLFADLLNETSSAANTADLAKMVADRKKRDVAMVAASAQHTKDIAALQADVAALKKKPSGVKSIADFSMKDWGEVGLMCVGGALIGYGVAIGMNYLLSDNDSK